MWKLLGLMALSASAQAQTFDYTAPLVSGTAIDLGPNGSTPVAFSGSYTADFTVQGSLAQGNLQLTAFDVSFVSNQGSFTPTVPNLMTGSGLSWVNANTAITLTTDAQGNVNGAVFAVNDQNYNAYNMAFSLGADDSFSYLSGASSCWNYTSGLGQMCSASASTALTGTWTEVKQASVAAPEMDPRGGLAAFLLLAGGLAVIRGRRQS